MWPEGDLALVSDDTRLLRHLVLQTPIVLEPKFLATYKPRVGFKAFFSHTYTRGTLFVDSYAGTTLIRRVLLGLFAVAPFVVVALALIGYFPFILIMLAVALIIPAGIGLVRKASAKAVASYVLLLIPFGSAFWAGVTRGLWVHRRYFSWTRQVKP